MIRIGILGDIGSGKSYVSRQFGCPVFDADAEVIKIYKNNTKCFYKLKKKFPKYIKSFPIKKDEILKIILNDKRNIQKIIKVIHPEVRKRMNKFIKKNQNKKIIILDIPLLLENKLNKKNDILIFVDAKKKDIKERLIKRLNFNLNIFNKLKKLQLPLEIKKKNLILQ